MPAFNLPPGVTLNDIDDLFEESDEDQCLDTEVEDLLDSADPGLGCRNPEAEVLGAPVEVSAERTTEAMIGGKYIGLFGIVIGINESTGECLVSLDETSHARFVEIEQAGFSDGLRDLDEDQWFCSGILEVVKQNQ